MHCIYKIHIVYMQISLLIIHASHLFYNMHLILLCSFFFLHGLYCLVLTHSLHLIFSIQQLYFGFGHSSFNPLECPKFPFFKTRWILFWMHISTLPKFNSKYHIGYIWRCWFFSYYLSYNKLFTSLTFLLGLLTQNTSLVNTS